MHPSIRGSMPTIDEVKNKVQRILMSNESVRLGQDGEFILEHNSARLFVEVEEGFGDDGILILFNIPMLKDVPVTPSLFEYAATEGQLFRLGGVVVGVQDGGKLANVWFKYAIVGDDLDESELMTSAYVLLVTCDNLDNQLQQRFGGHVVGD
jgi:hypothetical protein